MYQPDYDDEKTEEKKITPSEDTETFIAESGDELSIRDETLPMPADYTGKNSNRKVYILPFLLTGLIFLLDQLSKAFIVANWPRPGTIIKDVFDNEFLIICHVRNKVIAFSLGESIPEQFRFFLFVIIPICVLIFMVWYYLSTNEFTRLQRWAMAGIIGGGLGNIADRIFRPDGVVDFISVKFYGIFGMERWPTFNVADSAVVVSCLILLFTMMITKKKNAVHEDAQPEARPLV
jgi:signal peptidase II